MTEQMNWTDISHDHDVISNLEAVFFCIIYVVVVVVVVVESCTANSCPTVTWWLIKYTKQHVHFNRS